MGSLIIDHVNGLNMTDGENVTPVYVAAKPRSEAAIEILLEGGTFENGCKLSCQIRGSPREQAVEADMADLRGAVQILLDWGLTLAFLGTGLSIVEPFYIDTPR